MANHDPVFYWVDQFRGLPYFVLFIHNLELQDLARFEEELASNLEYETGARWSLGSIDRPEVDEAQGVVTNRYVLRPKTAPRGKISKALITRIVLKTLRQLGYKHPYKLPKHKIIGGE
jgi:hypothetical protein